MKMIKNGHELKMIKTSHEFEEKKKWLKMVKNSPQLVKKRYKTLKLAASWSKLVENFRKVVKMIKTIKIIEKVIENGHICVKNG
jgi:hypothetical protein